MNSCCAHNCTARDVKETREAGISFYRIPVKEPKRTLWLNAIGRKDFNPKPHTVICSQHFVGGEELVTLACKQLLDECTRDLMVGAAVAASVYAENPATR